ncbi:Arylsulfotransferase [Cordyceps fumosorosea ARSEF 2679]|uniref:Arylsulfotransferase n=1 Tax=Cordyceps fumosorosea (strain ARSEF 2679) TaxID=1081104 RepID=A0A167NC74_CORFA|nr:Arylsulfotransferase [Cordyceps fumosorosea ARSEF 2679]OAA55381.1 Arylsulfotransferase [Cordyceps fumosorosea ARSEF 2679]
MKAFLGLFITATALLPAVTADWQFRSRPDLAPPRLNITIPATDAVDAGYLFLTPFAGLADTPTAQHGPRQAAPYIFRDDGDLVWSGYAAFSVWAVNFQAARWRGRDVLFAFEGDHNAGYGHGHGHFTFLDQHYETVRELRAGNHRLAYKHEFRIVDEETALIQVYQPVPRDLSKWGAGPDQQWIVNAIFQELDISTGKVLFEWSSLDHVSPDEAVLGINPGHAGSGRNSSDAWDYFKINSVDKDARGDYLVSARDACAILKVNGTDGSVIWRLHGKRSDFSLGPGASFCFQHHARWLSQDSSTGVEVISLLDNSAHGTERNSGRGVHTAPTSSAKILRLDTRARRAELLAKYTPPPGGDALSKSQGSAQVLPNGNVLVGWGSEGAVTEFAAGGEPVFHARLDSGALAEGVQNYRAFRFNWTGLPSEDPAIVALAGAGGTTVYVSWNGDTETALWRFYAEAEGRGGFESRRLLGEVKRKSFETSLFVPGKRLEAVSAEALDAAGKHLVSTASVKTEPDIVPFRSGEKVLAKTMGRVWEQRILKKTKF